VSAPSASSFEDLDPFIRRDDFKKWVIDKFQLATATFATMMLYAGVLYYTWNPLATAVKHGQVGGFWSCALVVLGFLGVVLLIRDALVDRLYNPWRIFKGDSDNRRDWDRDVSKRVELLGTVVRPGFILLIAWAVATYLVK